MDFETREIRKMEMKDRKIKEKKPKSKVATVVIIFLVFLNLALSLYIIYDKKIYQLAFSFFQKEEEKKSIDLVENLSVDDETVSTLYSYLAPIKERFVMNSQVFAADLSEEEAKAFALSLLKEEDFEKVEGEEFDGVEYRLKAVFLEDAITKILGKDYSVSKDDLKKPYYQKYSNELKGDVLLSYDATFDSYQVMFEDPSEKEVEPFYTKLVKAEKKNNQIILTEKVVYTLEEKEKVSLYSDWGLSHLLEEEIADIDMDDFLDDASNVIYTFEKVGKNYQFISSKMMEK